MIKGMNDKEEFKKENLKSWGKNSEYWLSNPLRQVEDTREFFKDKLIDLVKNKPVIIDMGCGNGWVLEMLIELKLDFQYIGLDFNPKFIDFLKETYKDELRAEFLLVDLEATLPNTLINKADIIFNCFNFFEVANIESAFANADKMLKANGSLIIFTIEYTYLILALSKDMVEYKKYLALYEEFKSKGEAPFFFQKIDLGNGESEELKYASVLYSFNDYFQLARKHNLNLSDYGEVVKTSKFLPKTYQYFEFKK